MPGSPTYYRHQLASGFNMSKVSRSPRHQHSPGTNVPQARNKYSSVTLGMMMIMIIIIIIINN